VYIRTINSTNVNKTIPYYVVNSTANNFRLSANPGGAAINFGNATWGVSVTGGGLVDRNGYLNVRHSQDSDQNRYQIVSSAGTFLPGKSVSIRIETGIFAAARTAVYPAAASRYGPGSHLALGVVKSSGKDVALLAWYDSLGRKLVFSYNTDPAGNTQAQWQSNAVVLDEGAGTDVSMAVDSDGGIHLAYYSNVGANLKYAFIPAYTQGNIAQTVEVDSYLSVGTQTTIVVGKNAEGRQVPYISYYSSAGAGTTMSVRYAYRTDFSTGSIVPPGADESDRYTGKWEISVVPTANVPSNYKINVGVHRDTAGFLRPIPGAPAGVTPVAGSGGTKANRTAFYPISLNNSTSVFGNGTLNAVIGYTTGAMLEMAQQK
jgi:hypothetical protein